MAQLVTHKLMNPSSKTILRWISLVPAVLTIFYLFVMLAISIHIGAEALCPTEQIVSEACVADYMSWVKEGLLLATPPIASAFMIAGAYLCAPSHKLKAAIATFVFGSLAALYYAMKSEYWATFILTEAMAALVIFILSKKNSD